MSRLKKVVGKALGISSKKNKGSVGRDGSSGKRKGKRFEGSTQYTGLPAGVAVTPNTTQGGPAAPDFPGKKKLGSAKTVLG